jgi:hypothetical protein
VTGAGLAVVVWRDQRMDWASGELMAAWQGLLRLALFCRRQTTMAETFGIWEAHKRIASGVQAARCSAVPSAKLELDKVVSTKARITEPEVSLQIRFINAFSFGCE